MSARAFNKLRKTRGDDDADRCSSGKTFDRGTFLADFIRYWLRMPIKSRLHHKVSETYFFADITKKITKLFPFLIFTLHWFLPLKNRVSWSTQQNMIHSSQHQCRRQFEKRNCWKSIWFRRRISMKHWKRHFSLSQVYRHSYF